MEFELSKPTRYCSDHNWEPHKKITYSKYKAYVKKDHQNHGNAISEDQLQNLL